MNSAVAPAGRAQPRVLAPYTVRWTGELDVSPPVLCGMEGIVFGGSGEVPGDRCRDGVLWSRHALGRGLGKPLFKEIHAGRQRRAMSRLLCGVDAAPADRDEDGVLWLLGALPDGRIPEGEITREPPLCTACLDTAPGWTPSCAYLRQGHLVVRVRYPVLYGVDGTLFAKGPVGAPARPIGRIRGLSYEDERTAWVLADQMVRKLTGCTLTSTSGPARPELPVRLSRRAAVNMSQPAAADIRLRRR